MTAEVIAAPRVLSRAEASTLVGFRVEPQPVTVTTATIARDAATGDPVYAYLPVDGVAGLRRAVLATPWQETFRATSGKRNASRVFGYSPRKVATRRESCNRTALAREAPDTHRVLVDWSARLGETLRAELPEVAADGETQAQRVLPEWRLGEAEPWTSGVVNRTSELPYHRDGFNLPVWSAMPVVRRGVAGGYLHIPEYGAVVECRDGWALFFPGYDLVHGVTPMRTTTDGGYRISVVYYALSGMKDCFTAAVETAHGQSSRSQRERDMAGRLARGDRGIPGRATPRSSPVEGRTKPGRVPGSTT
jgi:hypothetical protein